MNPVPLNYAGPIEPPKKISVGTCLVWTVLHGFLTVVWFVLSVMTAILLTALHDGLRLLVVAGGIVLWFFITWGLANAEVAGRTTAHHRGRHLGMWLGVLIGVLLTIAVVFAVLMRWW